MRLSFIFQISTLLASATAFIPLPPSSFKRNKTLRMVDGGMEEIECDVLIVGGGPGGCTCALYTSRAQHKTILVDKNPTAGALAITHTIANYPGVDPTISGQALLDSMREQAIQYGTDYYRAQVFMLDLEGEYKKVFTPDATYKAKALVLATGAMGRKPTIKGEAEFLGSGVSYCATCDAAFYQGSEVAVVGLNQEAIDEAIFLTKFASTVHWLTPKAVPAEDFHAQELLSHSNVKLWENTLMSSIDGDFNGVNGITFKARGAEEMLTVPVEGVFIYVAGSKPITDYIGSTLEFQEDGGVKVDEEMATSVDGVFAIGDIRNTPFKQVVVAASDGCIAAMAIDKYLKGRKQIRVDWIHS